MRFHFSRGFEFHPKAKASALSISRSLLAFLLVDTHTRSFRGALLRPGALFDTCSVQPFFPRAW